MIRRIISATLLIILFGLVLTGGTTVSAMDIREYEPTQLDELIELRKKNSETYRLSDGTYECIVYADDKYFEDGSGDLVEIDNSIVSEKLEYGSREYGFSNVADSTRVHFAEDEPSVLVSFENKIITFSLDAIYKSSAAVGGLKDVAPNLDYTLLGKNYIAYPNIKEHTDLVYEVRHGLIKEYIILNDVDAPTEFSFTFETAGFTVSYTESGTIGLFDTDEKLVFELGNLFAVDSADAYTNELSYSIGKTENGRTIITISLSEKYAKSPERVYPILIDPSIVIKGTYKTYDTYVSSKNPTANYYHSPYLRMGWDTNYHVRRSYIKFDLPINVIGSHVNYSYMSLKKQNYGSDPKLKAYRVTTSWTSSTVNWNNKPSFSYNNVSNYAEEHTNDWFRFYVTDIVTSWCNQTYPNRGFMVRNDKESDLGNWSTFFSSDANWEDKPQLRINYTNGSFTMKSYLDNGFLTRFSNGVQKVSSYNEAVKSKLESIFPVDVKYSVYTFTSFCDKCRNQTYGAGNWGDSNLADVCPHTKQHLSVNPGFNQQDKSRGFYFDFINSKGVGTNTLTKYFWTGHIPSPADEPSFSVQYYNDAYIAHALHSIVCVMPGIVTQGPSHTNKSQSKVDTEYKFDLLHETSHQVGANDHYICNSPNNRPCNNPYCWYCHRPSGEPCCIMWARYDIDDLGQSTTYCTQCLDMIRTHLNDHHF